MTHNFDDIAHKFDYLAQRSVVLQVKSEIEATPLDTPGREGALASVQLFLTVTEPHIRRAIAIANRRNRHVSES